MPDLRRRLDPEARYGLRFTLFAVAFLLVAVPFGVLLAEVRREGPLTRVDTRVADRLYEWAHDSPTLVRALKVVTNLGSTWWLTILVAVAAVVLLRAGRRRTTIFLVFTSITTGLLIRILKALVGRDRPSLLDPVATAAGKSFPSGHAMGATAVYGALLVAFAPRMSPRARRVAVMSWFVLVASICFTRLALGVHYITDVLAGFVLGCAWLALSVAAFRVWQHEEAVEAASEVVEPER
jgi:membrane-associated phospholipid phosphatase